MRFYDDGVTIITLTTIILGCFAMTIKLIFQLKCRELKCCGICSLIRAVELEIDTIPPNTNVV